MSTTASTRTFREFSKRRNEQLSFRLNGSRQPVLTRDIYIMIGGLMTHQGKPREV
jgi:hypothetical protein